MSKLNNKYLNLYVSNNADQKSVISINQQFNQPFLQKPSDYNMSIVKFSISTQSIPIVLSSTALDTTRSIIVMYQTAGNAFHYSEQNITWLQSAYDETSGVRNYNQYDFARLLTAVNTAYANAFVALNAYGLSPNPPVFSLNTTTGLLNCEIHSSLVAPINTANAATYPSLPSGEALWICCGKGTSDWFSYFNNLEISRQTGATYPANLSNIIQFKQVLPTGTQTISQYASSLDNIRQVTNIVITSNLPVVNEGFPIFVVGANNTIANSNAGSDAEYSIIAEYSLLGNQTLASSVSLYYPTGEFRRTSLISDTPLSNVRIDTFFLSSGSPLNGNPSLIPLEIPVGSIFDMKILFEPK